MKNLPQLPNVSEEEQTPLVQTLLALLEQYSTRIVLLEESVAGLKDEINILKGEKKRPEFKPSKLDKSTDKKSGGTGDKAKKRAGSDKRSKTAQLEIHEVVCIAPGSAVPPDSRFKGYRDFVVQDLIITSHNTRYRLERWVTPQGDTLNAASCAAQRAPLWDRSRSLHPVPASSLSDHSATAVGTTARIRC